MYLTIISESLHGNKEGWISDSIKDVKIDLIKHLKNWDCEYSESELSIILERGWGLAGEKNKSCVDVEISPIKFGEAFVLE
jgi:hypothetical protein